MKPLPHGSVQAQRLEQAAQWVLRLSDGASADDEIEFEAWLAADPDNRKALEGLTSTLRDVERFAGEPEMVGLRGQALSAARRSHELRRIKARFSSRLGIAASVACLAIALGAATLWHQFTSDRFATGIGERRLVALADGSHLSLDAATKVTVDYTADRRRLVLERGRARFDVAKDPLRPFMVEARGKVVVATGTSFSVELIEGQVRVVLYEGRVEVLQAADRIPLLGSDRGSAAVVTVLEPGHELIASTIEAQPAVQVASIDATRSLAWEAGDLAFADEPLGFAIERVNRYADRPLRVADAAAAKVRISGVFHAGDTEAFIDGVTDLFPIRAERDEDGVTLLSENAPEH